MHKPMHEDTQPNQLSDAPTKASTEEEDQLNPLFEKEIDLIQIRRAKANVRLLDTSQKPYNHAVMAGTVGVALSGGGIRSATFCLGVFQSLARNKLLRHMDYLSTVSGGGFFGSFLGRMFTREWVKDAQDADANSGAMSGAAAASIRAGDPRSHRLADYKSFMEDLHEASVTADNLKPDPVVRVETALADAQSPPLIWLRESGNYLAPNGGKDMALDVGIYLRNWISMLVVMLTTGMTFFLAFNCLRFSIGWTTFENDLANAAGPHLWWTPAIAIPLIVAAVCVVPLGMTYWLTQLLKDKVLDIWAAYAVIIIFGVVAIWQKWTGGLKIAFIVMASITFLGILWWIGFRLSARHERIQNWVPWIRNHMTGWLRAGLLLFAASLVFAIVDAWGQSLYSVVSFAGNLNKAVPAVSGILGVTALAPLVRSLLLARTPTSGKFQVPFRVIALIFSGFLVLAAFTALAFISHGLAWKWAVPDASTPAESPGARLYNNWCVDTNVVHLTADRLIQVAPCVCPPDSRTAQQLPDVSLLYGVFGLSLLLSLLFGQTVGFLNLSSYYTLYSSRVIRAYQGASSRKRWSVDANVTRAEDDDDVRWSEYHPYQSGGPLHLINCTVNCTESVETAAESTTAKGLNLCISPAGIVYGQHLAVFSFDADPGKATPIVNGKLSDKPVAVEPLTLGSWVGISGAAFSTGLGNVGGGAGTTLGTSLLCGLFNVRLGYWWKNDFSPFRKAGKNNLFPVQTYLADEFTASFHIVNRDHWYLSDGGHFENTAAYELIRRRVPFIVLVDCGADPDGSFDDLSNLARRVRVDFGAEIMFAARENFKDDAELSGKLIDPSFPIGWLEDIRSTMQFVGDTDPNLVASAIKNMQNGEDPLQAPRIRKHAALAEVVYSDPPGKSIILVIKPGLNNDEPADLINYQRNNPSFPQQATSNQFYDEAEWESYRRLGEHSMDTILTADWLKNKMARTAK